MSRLRVAKKMVDSRTIRMSVRQPGETGEELKKLIDGRDNDEIIRYLESQSSDCMKYFKVILLDLVVLLVSKNAVALLDYILICYSFFQSAVLQLTVLNDPETLSSILSWGEKLGLTPGTGGEHQE